MIYHMTANHEDAHDRRRSRSSKYQALKTFKGDWSFFTWVIDRD